jgi:hypothetical protein
MRKLSLLALVLLGACASSWDDVEARCGAIEDVGARKACFRQLLADDQARGDNNGIGPPSCHSASTNRDLERKRC